MARVEEGEPGRAPGLWSEPAPGRLVGRGHAAGDFLQAYDWDLLERSEGRLRVGVRLPEHLRNPKGQLFGGFTPTYVDFLALHTYWAGREPTPGRPWLATVNMRLDYYAPVTGDGFEIACRVVNRRGVMTYVETRFFDPEGEMLVYAYTTLKEV